MSNLAFDDLAKGWGLLQLPKMPELKRLAMDRRLGLGIDIDALRFKNTTKEKKRQDALAAQRVAVAAAATDTSAAATASQPPSGMRRKTDAWSAKHDREDLKTARREKKRRRREAEARAHMTEPEKEERRELDALVAEVRRRNAAHVRGSGSGDEFEGFAD